MESITEDDLLLKIYVQTMLYIIGTEDMLQIWRSPVVPVDHPAMLKAREFASEFGLVLIEQETEKDENMMFGECEVSCYVKPSMRIAVHAKGELGHI